MSEDEAMMRLRTARESDLGVAFRVFQERTDQRLAHGAETMSAIKRDLAEAMTEIEGLQPKPRPMWHLVTFGFVVITAVCGWVWQVARYPDRAEFEAVKADTTVHMRELDGRIADLNLQLERIRIQLQALSERGRK